MVYNIRIELEFAQTLLSPCVTCYSAPWGDTGESLSRNENTGRGNYPTALPTSLQPHTRSQNLLEIQITDCVSVTQLLNFDRELCVTERHMMRGLNEKAFKKHSHSHKSGSGFRLSSGKLRMKRFWV